MGDQDIGVDESMRNHTKGLTALVIGGGSGIGASSALAFAAYGGHVLVSGRNLASASVVADTIRRRGGTATAFELDVSLTSEVETVIPDVIRSNGGRLDALINSAARVAPGPLEDLSASDWTSVFDVNVGGALSSALACLPFLKQSPNASIIHIASLGGVFGRPFGGAYGPSKAALIALTKQMAMEWAPMGIRANVVNPGTIDTPLARSTVPDATLAERARAIPAGRLGDPDEVAEVIVFLTTRAASYVTAQSINVDGGHSQSLLFAPMGR